MALHIGQFGDVLRTLHCDVIFQSPKNVGSGRPQDVCRGRPLTLHRGPYGDVHRMTFGDVSRTSSGYSQYKFNPTIKKITNLRKIFR